MTMDTAKKQDLLNKKAEQHKTTDTTKKQKLLEKWKKEYSYHSSKTVISRVEYVVYVIEHFIKKSVLKLNTRSYLPRDIFKIQSSYDWKEYICQTCHSETIQWKIPCQAIIRNNFNVNYVPTEIGNLKKLEQIIIAWHIVFDKVTVMPKGQ